MYSKNIASFHSYEIEAILIFMIVHYIFYKDAVY